MQSLSKQSRETLIKRLVDDMILSGNVQDLIRDGFCGFASMPDEYLLDAASDAEVDVSDLEVTVDERPMRDFRVMWEIDVTAADAKTAAEVARYYQRPGTSADTFDVFDAKGDMTRVRLNEEDESED